MERRRREWKRREHRGGSAVGATIEAPTWQGCGVWEGYPPLHWGTGVGRGCAPSPEKFSILVRFLVHSGLLFLQISGPFCTQIMLIDDRPYTTFPSGPKNEKAVASSCLNVVTALIQMRSAVLAQRHSPPRTRLRIHQTTTQPCRVIFTVLHGMQMRSI